MSAAKLRLWRGPTIYFRAQRYCPQPEKSDALFEELEGEARKPQALHV